MGRSGLAKFLETRFRFVETDRYPYQRLLEVKQGKDENVLSFSDTEIFGHFGRSYSTKCVPTEMREETAVYVYTWPYTKNMSTAVQLQATNTMERGP